jgi:heme/copper-type cytochrome/quinol oxidase subunit 4
MDNLLWRDISRSFYFRLGVISCQRQKERRINMGALIMFGMVIVIANVGGLYFLMQDKKEAHKAK